MATGRYAAARPRVRVSGGDACPPGRGFGLGCRHGCLIIGSTSRICQKRPIHRQPPTEYAFKLPARPGRVSFGPAAGPDSGGGWPGPARGRSRPPGEAGHWKSRHRIMGSRPTPGHGPGPRPHQAAELGLSNREFFEENGVLLRVPHLFLITSQKI